MLSKGYSTMQTIHTQMGVASHAPVALSFCISVLFRKATCLPLPLAVAIGSILLCVLTAEFQKHDKKYSSHITLKVLSLLSQGNHLFFAPFYCICWGKLTGNDSLKCFSKQERYADFSCKITAFFKLKAI